jgi:beta-N-acetylhexosaminidase
MSSAAPATSPRTTISHAPPPGSTQPAVSDAQRILDRLTERQRVGQLLMVDCPTSGLAAATVAAISDDDVGSVILDGTSFAGASVIESLTSRLQSLAPKSVRLFVATDQEGGLVQRLQGPGFTRIPSALQQGGYPTSILFGDARQWGRELKRVGVNVNLAPVLDIVPSGFGSNPPIGDLDREYGHSPSAYNPQMAFYNGFAAAGVAATGKHFPGLGRVHGNTDTDSGVTDVVTTRHDSYLQPFAIAVRAGVPFMMMSTAIYSRIDPGTPAAFSKTIVTGMLRGDLGFRGIVISDDLGAAKQVAGYSVGQRAVDFVAAGGDLVLTVDAGEAGTMSDALLARAAADPAFKRQVDTAALRVLQEKQRRGLLG